jgi:hypothetical protein
MSPLPTVVYKYVDQDGVRKIIANGTLRFGRPADMNDPFDIYIEDLFNVSLEEIQQRSIAPLLELLEQDPDRFASFTSAEPEGAKRVAELVKSMSRPERAALVVAITSEKIEMEDGELADMRKRMEPQLESIIAEFKNSGIFCATRNHDNLLMWAHYAQQHRGVVLGFRPDIERDSFLAILEPVQYTDARPTFYKPIDDMIENNGIFTPSNVAKLRHALFHSKSTHWSYEEELRVVIPREVPVGQSATFLRFYPHKLCEMYLGCRVDGTFRSEIMAAAKALNSSIAIFDARPDKASYALNFEPAA